MKRLPQIALPAALVVLLAGCADAPPPEGSDAAETPPAVAVRPAPEMPLPTAEELAALRLAVEQAPDDKRTRRRLAIALFEAGNTDESLAMFEEDTRTNPGVASLLNLGRAYGRVLRYPDAEATYRKVLDQAPSHPTALHALGNLALKRGDTNEAIDLYRAAIASRPDYIMAHAHLADALQRIGDSRAAHGAYARILELQPSNPQEVELYQDAVYNLASIKLAAGAPDQAVELLEQLLQVRPDHESAYYAYGQALMMLGREDDAQQAFETHMEIQARRKPTSPMAMGD